MEKQQLLKTLELLHEQLAQTESVDDETRAHLTTLTEDIRRISEEESVEGEDPLGPITGQLQDLVQHFGAEHPQLARALNQVAAALANLGI